MSMYPRMLGQDALMRVYLAVQLGPICPDARTTKTIPVFACSSVSLYVCFYENPCILYGVSWMSENCVEALSTAAFVISYRFVLLMF